MHHAEPHQVSAISKPDKILKLDGISPESVEAHWGLYEAYVKKYNEVMEKLPGADRGAANQIYSDYRGFREMLTFAIGGIKNHEVYFQNLSADGGSPSDALAAQVEKDFGGHDDMITELKAGGMAARGWAWVAWDWARLDVYEHSYIRDFSTARPKYIDAFIANIDWADVSGRWERIAKEL